MPRYTVAWHPVAEAQLAQIWIELPNRTEVTKAADLIDRELAEHPFSVGEPISERSREWEVPPLGVLYSVSELDRMVWIVRFRLILPEF